MQNNTPSMLSLFWTFLKLSPVSFGGGYAIFPVLEREIVDKRRWMKSDTLMDTLSLASASPGGVAVNAAILLGHRLKGWPGAIAASCGSILPSLMIVLALYSIYAKVGASPKVEAGLTGITWGVMTLILFSAIRMSKKAVKDTTTLVLLVVALVALLLGLAPLYAILAGIGLGVLFAFIRGPRNEDKRAAEKRVSDTKEDPAYMYFI